MPDAAGHRVGFSATERREAKARKIHAVIEAVQGPLRAEDMVLDIGSGSGAIASALGAHATVHATDRVDQRTVRDGYRFVLSEERLPFPAAVFDVVISNHVIEHVSNPARHLEEIRRVMKPTGICYLATPNRWWPMEVHSQVALLHWLPAALFNRIALRTGHLAEAVQLQSLPTLRQLASGKLDIFPWHDRIVCEWARFAVEMPGWARLVVRMLPRFLIQWTRGLHPTLIVVLRPIQR